MPQHVVAQSNAIKRSWMVIDNLTRDQRIEPHRDIVALSGEGLYSKVIVYLRELQIVELQEIKSTGRREGRIFVSTNCKKVSEYRPIISKLKVHRQAFVEHGLGNVVHSFSLG